MSNIYPIRTLFLLAATALFTGQVNAQACQNPLTSAMNQNNGQDGIMFTVTAKRDLVIDSFANNYANGTISAIEIYYKWGIVTGSQATAGDWTQIGTATSITSAGTNNLTIIPLNVNFAMSQFQTASFYITTTGGTNPICRYTNGAAVCDSLYGNNDLNLYEGYGKDYPFAASFSPRRFNGRIFYHCDSTVNYGIVGTSSFCNVTNGYQTTYSIDPPIEGDEIFWDLPAGMSFVGSSLNDTITVQINNTNVSGEICFSLVGCDTFYTQCLQITTNPPTADAGADVSVCTDQYQLNGNSASGHWELISGTGTFSDPTDSNATVSGLNLGVNIFSWNIGGLGCDSAFDTVVIVRNPTPVASFAANDVCLYDAMTFTNLSYTQGGGNIVGLEWDIFNNSTVDNTNQSFFYNFTTAGVYQVKLTVQTDAGCYDSETQSVEAFPIPVPNFSFVQECENDPVQFTNLSTLTTGSLSSFLWQFGDNTATSNLQHPTHAYAGDGTYTVSLLVMSAAGCQSDTSYQIEIYADPIADFSMPFDCQQDWLFGYDSSHVFDDDNLVFWLWTFGDATPADANQNTTHYFANPGTYPVSLAVITNHGCADTVTKAIEVYPTPEAFFTTDGICENAIVRFVDSSTVAPLLGSVVSAWNWNLDNDKTSNQQNTLHIYRKPGPITVVLDVYTNYGCHDQTNTEVIIRPQPEAHILIINNEVCALNEVMFKDESYFDYTYDTAGITSWHWDFADGQFSGLPNPTNTFALGGNYEVQLIASTDYDCADTTTRMAIIHHNPKAEFFVKNDEGCSPLCVNITDLASVASSDRLTHTWQFGDGAEATGLVDKYCYEIAAGGADTAYRLWQFVKTDKGCTDTFSAPNLAVVHANPIAAFELEKASISVLDSVVRLSDRSTGAYQWLWLFGDSTSSTLPEPEDHVYNTAGTYTVWQVVKSADDCLDSTAKTVTVHPHQTLFYPTSFTPDGNGRNDVFEIVGEDLEYVHLTIFNRWGNVVHDQEGTAALWDGRVENELAPLGVYTFTLAYRHSGKNLENTRGTFVISRTDTAP